MRTLALFILFLMFIPLTFGATIEGAIYGVDLDVKENAVLTIDTQPKQQLVSRDGTYELNVPEGIYTLTATYEDLQAQEGIVIVDNGTYHLDLFLFPILEDDEALLAQDFSIEDEARELNIRQYLTDAAVIIVLILILAGLWMFKKKYTPETIEEPSKLAVQVLDFIRVQGGTTTQKEIRKHLHLSETKSSILIAELEQQGKVKKIKKGRANIVSLLKD